MKRWLMIGTQGGRRVTVVALSLAFLMGFGAPQSRSQSRMPPGGIRPILVVPPQAQTQLPSQHRTAPIPTNSPDVQPSSKKQPSGRNCSASGGCSPAKSKYPGSKPANSNDYLAPLEYPKVTGRWSFKDKTSDIAMRLQDDLRFSISIRWNQGGRNIFYGKYTYVDGALKLVFDRNLDYAPPDRSYRISEVDNRLYLLPDGQFNRLQYVGSLPNPGKKQ
jgi:hypothetical protein